MGRARVPGPTCGSKLPAGYIDDGTTCRERSLPLGPICAEENREEEQEELERLFQIVEGDAIAFGTRFVKDGKVRSDYIAAIRRMRDEVMAAYRAGQISANELRNGIMNAQRAASSELGLAMAEKAKLVGRTLEELQEKYALKLFGNKFAALTEAQQGKVYLIIIERSGVGDIGYVKLGGALRQDRPRDGGAGHRYRRLQHLDRRQQDRSSRQGRDRRGWWDAGGSGRRGAGRSGVRGRRAGLCRHRRLRWRRPGGDGRRVDLRSLHPQLTSTARVSLNVLSPSAEGVPRARLIFEDRPTELVVDAETIAAELPCQAGVVLFLSYLCSTGDAVSILLLDREGQRLDQLHVGFFASMGQAWLSNIAAVGDDTFTFSLGEGTWRLRVDRQPSRLPRHLLSSNVTSAMPRFSPHWLSVIPPP